MVSVAIAVSALAAASPGASQAEPQVSVAVAPSAPVQSGGRAPLGQREWAVAFRVTVTSESTCENLSVAYSYRTLFDGRASLGEAVSESFDTGAPASAAAFAVRASADAGETVALRARGTCELEDGTVLSASEPAVASVAVAAHSCEGGPLRVLALSGSAKRADFGSRFPVRTGHLLRPGDDVTLGRRSRLVFGAPDCGGLRVSVSGRSNLTFVPGEYARGSDGFPTTLGSGGWADFRGDQHSGGVQTANAIALPRGARGAPSRVARFRIESLARRVTSVHVASGSVYVAPRLGSGYGHALVVRAGGTARCYGRACATR